MKSHQISAFFLLMTVLLSSTLAQHGNGPDVCCFKYLNGELSIDLIAGYEETRGDCSQLGIILYTRTGKELCVNPRDHWVQQIKKELDQRLNQ